jgi:hypothetical protein
MSECLEFVLMFLSLINHHKSNIEVLNIQTMYPYRVLAMLEKLALAILRMSS